MGFVDDYGYSGIGTSIGVGLGLLFGFILHELAWITVIYTAIGSLFGTIMDARITRIVNTQQPISPVLLED